MAADDSDGARMAGVRNLFHPKRDQRLDLGGLVAEARRPGGDEKPLRRLLAKLARRIDRGTAWANDLLPVDPDRPADENPGIPSGYTYLLQLIAHDMIDSEVSLAEAGPGRSGFANTRVAPLALDTIYGGGPDNTPGVYEYDRLVRQNRDSLPRTRLRLGSIARADGFTAGCPMRDLARAVLMDAADGGLASGEMLDMATLNAARTSEDPPIRPWRTEALVADIRNDSHALISQMTVLFHILHNHVLELLGAPTTDAVLAYRRYLCARLAVTMIFRSIVVRDVLPRILDPRVYSQYMAADASLLEPDAADDHLLDLPLEFSHGAFRFGHAMTRPAYRVNADSLEPFDQALAQSSVHAPNALPVRERWHVDWSRFFETGPQSPNLSMRIGPSTAWPLRNSSDFPATVPGLDASGVVGRDLVSAAYAGLWSVPKLTEHLRTLPGMTEIVPDFAVWKPVVADWLARTSDDLEGEPFDATEIERLSADPPLPFFVMLEAAYTLDAGIPKPYRGGQRLGALGSVIVAETIFGAMSRSPIAFEDGGRMLGDNIAAACADLVGDAGALVAIPDIADMPALLRFLNAGGAINLPGRA